MFASQLALFPLHALRLQPHREDLLVGIEYRGRPAAECLLVDMTETKQLRERLADTERLSALGELASGVAHDFNNLLGAILGRTQLLRKRGFDAEIDREMAVVEKAAMDGRETVRRIQEFSRVRTDRPVSTVDLSEIIFGAQALTAEDKAVQTKLAEIRDYGRIPEAIPLEYILRQARLSVVIDRWMEDNQCDASAVECWDSIQKNYGCATCLSMSMMGERLMPSACEVDVVGAVSMYALLLASGNPPGFQDWNNNYGDDRDKCINVHCSNYPVGFMGKEVEISSLDVLGASLGEDRCFGAVKGQVAAGPMTFFRLTTDDPKGIIRAYLGEGDFTDDPVGIDGGSAVCKVENLQDLMDYVCKNGFEHHVALTRDHCADVLHEALETYLGWDLYHHNQ